ncbi:succinylglutamate desuccinylase/aspartoacylase domain-containing protein [Methanobacterium alcaliphilum]|uniref:succinylglutamate desuccinylase/aspartoacylase domain-containing protein n=1 Tax=Methanobacterium alcaliphilum TaxID=392018 RepID=UPI00200B1006|nr:succinylglutamate desuccinylase/aspartoacylase family protein [Methanobacterium alcaliphilum]MCK9151847.1 succinylglutamate desuccinylase/aspartoacylase family protein [Methanobacterium alcaliphilum]
MIFVFFIAIAGTVTAADTQNSNAEITKVKDTSTVSSISNNTTKSSSVTTNGSAKKNYTIKIINRKTGGNVLKNWRIKKNIPNSAICREVVEAAKKGTPMVIFGNGKGPRVMMVAGIHPNELPTQIAAMKLINVLNGKTIKGTIYIIPFVAPSSTAKNIRRFNGRNLNHISYVKGSPSNIVVRMAKKYNVKYLGDFHCTNTYDAYPLGQNVILTHPGGSKLARYIGKYARSPVHSVMQYRGLLTTVTTRNGIRSVICETKSTDGTIFPGSINASIRHMKGFLKFFKRFFNLKIHGFNFNGINY